MIQVVVENDNFCRQADWHPQARDLLPEHSLMVQNTPFYYGTRSWNDFFSACQKLRAAYPTVPYVFIDASWDPVTLSNDEIIKNLEKIKKIFAPSKVIMLSARAQHWFDNIPNVLYFPLFAMLTVGNAQPMPRQGRMGCLNRRNALHRIRLMYELLSRNLVDAERDIFSISFTNLWTKTPYNFSHSNYEYLQHTLLSWPDSIATHPDDFVNDYNINHPAWHTGIAIVTETESDDNTILSEKTAKALVSKSCFSIYMADVGYRVLEELGFEPRFFSEHAEYDNIDPLISLCQRIETESQAMEYRQNYIDQIEHNYAWFGNDQTIVPHRPWYSRYAPKLRQALDNL